MGYQANKVEDTVVERQMDSKAYPEVRQEFEKYFKPPNFTMKEIRDAVPAHCFQRCTKTSLMYLCRDLAAVVTLFYLATFIDRIPWVTLRYTAWVTYWITQGMAANAIWVLSHECGHRAFSAHNWVNDLVGWTFHSALLVPFHSWRFSHGIHHKNTNHMDRDQPYVPKTRTEFGVKMGELLDETPIYRLGRLLGLSLFGFQTYLYNNLYGPKATANQSHFNPYSKLFNEKQRHLVVISDIGVFLTIAGLFYCAYVYSPMAVVKFYFLPWFNINFWLILITYLQHTDPFVPHYRGEQWNFVRGSLATVDRDFGILNTIFHHITDTHVVHHLFSQMPHYHAVEATQHVKKVLGKYYLYDKTHWVKRLIQNERRCGFVEDEGDIVWWKGRKNYEY